MRAAATGSSGCGLGSFSHQPLRCARLDQAWGGYGCLFSDGTARQHSLNPVPVSSLCGFQIAVTDWCTIDGSKHRHLVQKPPYGQIATHGEVLCRQSAASTNAAIDVVGIPQDMPTEESAFSFFSSYSGATQDSLASFLDRAASSCRSAGLRNLALNPTKPFASIVTLSPCPTAGSPTLTFPASQAAFTLLKNIVLSSFQASTSLVLS